MAGPDAPDLEMLLRRIIREECGLTPAAPADKWRGGELVLRPGKPGLGEDRHRTFFHKVDAQEPAPRARAAINTLEVRRT
jgi:hypothetical protein